MDISTIGKELYKFCESHYMLKILLPLGSVMAYFCVSLLTFGEIISLGGFASALLRYLFYLGVILAFANLDYKNITLLLGLMGLVHVLAFSNALFLSGAFRAEEIIHAPVHIFLAFQSYKKYLKIRL